MAVLVEACIDGAALPTLILAGRAEPNFLAYIEELRLHGASTAKLWHEATALYRFATFYETLGSRYAGAELLQAFYGALRGASPELALNSITHTTARKYLAAVNRFGDWLSAKSGCFNPNPTLKIPLSYSEQAMAMARHRSTSLVPQLAANTAAGMGYKFGRRYDVASVDRNGAAPRSRPRKVMSIENYNRLLCTEQSVRNLLLWLLLGATGRRVSEVLQLFCSDIVIDRARHEARVILADPRWGAVYLPNGKRMTREIYLRNFYGLCPRDSLPLSDGKRAGWKGMVPDETQDLWAEAMFMYPGVYQRLFLQCHIAYSAFRRTTGSDNPYYFVNIDHKRGAPLTRHNVTQILHTSCKRANIPPPTNPHSLRHCYGDTLTNRLGFTVAEVQVLMRHRSYNSTLVYSSPSSASIRERLRDAESRAPMELHFTIPNARG